MSTHTSTLNTRPQRPPGTRRPERSHRAAPGSGRRSRVPSVECAPTSMLDEAGRRMKANMLAIASILRLDAPGVERDATELLLTDMETRLQSIAQLHRSLCRFGDFDQIDLAVYLRHAARLRNTPPRVALPGGWGLDADQALAWVRDEEGVDSALCHLETALDSIAAGSRELARRAIYAAAILVPPWLFAWRAPQPGPSGIGHLAKPGEVGIRLRATCEGVCVELSISDRGPGLPEAFDSNLQRKLALEMVSVLARLVKGSMNGAPEAGAVFEVGFVPSLARTPWLGFDTDKEPAYL